MTNDQAMVVVGTRPLPATKQNVETMKRFVQVMDPRADPKQAWALAVVAVRLGLHPFNNEVMLYEGQVFITIHGRRRLAERSGDLAAIQPGIVRDEQLRRDLGATTKGDIVAECRIYRRSDERPTIQYSLLRAIERWPSDKEAEQLGVSRHQIEKLRNNDDPDGLFALVTNPRAKVRPIIMQPQLMAMKRAEARALDALAGVPLPTYDPEMGTQVANGVLPGYMLQEDPDGAPATAEPSPAPQAPPTTPPETTPAPTSTPPSSPPPSAKASAPPSPTPSPEPPSTPSSPPAQGQAELLPPCPKDWRSCNCAEHQAERAARRGRD